MSTPLPAYLLLLVERGASMAHIVRATLADRSLDDPGKRLLIQGSLKKKPRARNPHYP